MSTTVKWLLNINPVNGPKLSPVGTLDVEAYELISAQVEGGGGTATVTLPSANENLSLVAITAGEYNSDGDLFYTINGEAPTYALEAPHVMIGAGAVAYLTAASGGSTDPAELLFTNNTGEEVGITILVGRDAVS